MKVLLALALGLVLTGCTEAKKNPQEDSTNKKNPPTAAPGADSSALNTTTTTNEQLPAGAEEMVLFNIRYFTPTTKQGDMLHDHRDDESNPGSTTYYYYNLSKHPKDVDIHYSYPGYFQDKSAGDATKCWFELRVNGLPSDNALLEKIKNALAFANLKSVTVNNVVGADYAPSEIMPMEIKTQPNRIEVSLVTSELGKYLTFYRLAAKDSSKSLMDLFNQLIPGHNGTTKFVYISRMKCDR